MWIEQTAFRGRRILLAEDDSELRAVIGYCLGLDGHEVVAMANGVKLTSWLSVSPHADVIISDVRMPGPSGLEVLARFRLTDSSTPFVLMTAFGSVNFHHDAQQLGATALIDKPFEMDDLRALIRGLVPPDDAGSTGASSKVVRQFPAG
ncbi:MAG TPA: response regulator [Vicinamibacteria bacterium]|nr:response regulator [Vicinamibacteria bacterium]